ncbi:hypothetical protein Emed_007646 [Eimeria media]
MESHSEWEAEIAGKPNSVLFVRAAIKALGGPAEHEPASPPQEEVISEDEESVSVGDELPPARSDEVESTSDPRGSHPPPAEATTARPPPGPTTTETTQGSRQKRKAGGISESSNPPTATPCDWGALWGKLEIEKASAELRIDQLRQLQGLLDLLKSQAVEDYERVSDMAKQARVFPVIWEALRRRGEREEELLQEIEALRKEREVLLQERDLARRAVETALEELSQLKAALPAPTRAEAAAQRLTSEGAEAAPPHPAPAAPAAEMQRVGGPRRARTRVTLAAPPVPPPILDPSALQLWQTWWIGMMAMANRVGIPPPMMPLMPQGAPPVAPLSTDVTPTPGYLGWAAPPEGQLMAGVTPAVPAFPGGDGGAPLGIRKSETQEAQPEQGVDTTHPDQDPDGGAGASSPPAGESAPDPVLSPLHRTSAVPLSALRSSASPSPSDETGDRPLPSQEPEAGRRRTR